DLAWGRSRSSGPVPPGPTGASAGDKSVASTRASAGLDVLGSLVVRRWIVTVAVIASARAAHAIPYETFIDVDSESDLQDLLSMQEITQDTFDELVDLLSAGVDLNTADRAELYTLPNLTYDDVDKIIAYRDKMGGYVKDPAELVTAGALTSEKLLSISAFLIVRPPGGNPR